MKETENESIQRKILHKNCPMKYFSQEEKNQKKTHKKGRQLTIENLEGSRATRTMLPGGRYGVVGEYKADVAIKKFEVEFFRESNGREEAEGAEGDVSENSETRSVEGNLWEEEVTGWVVRRKDEGEGAGEMVCESCGVCDGVCSPTIAKPTCELRMSMDILI